MKSLVTTVILGALLAEFGLSGFHTEANDGHTAEQQAAAVMERIVPPGVDDEYFSGRTLPRAEINKSSSTELSRLQQSIRSYSVLVTLLATKWVKAYAHLPTPWQKI